MIAKNKNHLTNIDCWFKIPWEIIFPMNNSFGDLRNCDSVNFLSTRSAQ